MKQINFDQASRLIGRKGITVVNENHEPVISWAQFFKCQRYYTESENLLILEPKI